LLHAERVANQRKPDISRYLFTSKRLESNIYDQELPRMETQANLRMVNGSQVSKYR